MLGEVSDGLLLLSPPPQSTMRMSVIPLGVFVTHKNPANAHMASKMEMTSEHFFFAF